MTKRTPKQEARIARDRTVVNALKPVDLCCGQCDYEEADGSLFNHCDKCCRLIVTLLCKRRNSAARRLKEEK